MRGLFAQELIPVRPEGGLDPLNIGLEIWEPALGLLPEVVVLWKVVEEGCQEPED